MVTVVMIPRKRFIQARVTKAVEGIEKKKLAGYIIGTEENLKKEEIFTCNIYLVQVQIQCSGTLTHIRRE